MSGERWIEADRDIAAAALLAERLPRTIAAFRDTIDAPC
jgi:hypothetical protein